MNERAHGHRWAWADVDLDAVRHNVAHLRATVAPAQVWAVVKADGYGHGATETARAALDAGAAGLCVALVEEGVRLRLAGIGAPILILSELPAESAPVIAAHGLTATVTTIEGVSALAEAWRAAGSVGGVHVKIDTGMHRVGAAPDAAVVLARRIHHDDGLRLEGTYTHFACADTPGHEANERQSSVFADAIAAIREAGIDPGLVHAANSAAALSRPESRFDMVRTGIAVYGLLPGPELVRECEQLRPVMSLRARVSAVRWVESGDAVSYGLRRPLTVRSLVATVPIGYADGVPRRLWESGTPVLIGGRMRPIAGTVTMDQIMVDCGPDGDVAIGDEVTLIGGQGAERVDVADWAGTLGTISYEVTCGISARVGRRHR